MSTRALFKRKGSSCCVAVGCSMRGGTNLLSTIKLFSFPRDPIRRKLWELAVHRACWETTKFSRLCSLHFVTGRPVNDENHPDYVPSIFAYNQDKKLKKKVWNTRKTNKTVTSAMASVSKASEVGKDCAVAKSSENPVQASPNILVLLPYNPNQNVNIQSKGVSATDQPESSVQASKVGEVPYEKPGKLTRATVFPTIHTLSTDKPKQNVGNVSANQPDSDVLASDLVEAAYETHEKSAQATSASTTITRSGVNRQSLATKEPDSHIHPYEFVEASYGKPAFDEDSCESESSGESNTAVSKSVTKEGNGIIPDFLVQDAQEEKKELEAKLSRAYDELNSLREDLRMLQKKASHCDPTKAILENEEQFSYYTGLPSIDTFNWILQSMEGDVCKSKLPLETQLLIVLMKLKLNLMHMDLAYKFNIAYNTVQKILNAWVPVLEQKHGDLISCPKKKKRKEATGVKKSAKVLKKQLNKKEQSEKSNVQRSEEKQLHEEDSIQNWLTKIC